ncbi:hypothetical protein ACWT_4823 [Actinoplanes sp. SE50]|uniref:flagellar brake protein n=1 Tax=unclassified Actinoplanes TaxID=2626549 RepID=UPI00023EC30A|nr:MULTISPECIES: PilZ domain-containing protein [unclassified Actinoplanes]AEV85842.1 hypothetical protein ACPL_4953 [Actinoplanes sp. SE50/110]ATO84238.1 hypothetical protein ACWT_4823 [Actinoplanes sp. SE50]SLM01648.1 hypothetical protein ACSP50_4884 [Actinoplanes sp. SE50/110]
MVAAVSSTVELPAVGTPMFLVLGEGMNFRSRLEAVDGDRFTVAAPLETAGPVVISAGQQFDVFWAPPSTRIVLPARLVAVSDEAPFRWSLTAAGLPQHSNRREFVRGGGGAAVRLTTDDGEIEGALLDISEGGLRCWIDEPAALAAGGRMAAAVTLGAAGTIEVSGTILSVREAPYGDPGRHVVLTFDPRESAARAIRRYVMEWEINERRLHRDAA